MHTFIQLSCYWTFHSTYLLLNNHLTILILNHQMTMSSCFVGKTQSLSCLIKLWCNARTLDLLDWCWWSLLTHWSQTIDRRQISLFQKFTALNLFRKLDHTVWFHSIVSWGHLSSSVKKDIFHSKWINCYPAIASITLFAQYRLCWK